jgi:hypothetical protein
MPVRNNVGASSPNDENPFASAAKAPTTAAKPAASDDNWEKIMEAQESSKVSEDENGFNKTNTNFYLRDDEETNIIFLDDAPYLFHGHNLKMFSKNNKEYYQTEACQKMTQKTCEFCSGGYSVTQKVAFTILDSRGNWDTKKADFDYNPAPKLFVVPIALAKIIKQTRDECGGTLTDKVMKLSRANKNYSIRAVMEQVPGQPKGTLRYKPSIKFSKAIPDPTVIYGPVNDLMAQNILNRAAAPGDNKYAKKGNDDSSGGNTKSTF